MATRPTEFLDWVPSNSPTAIIEPPTGQKNSGWLPGEIPPAQYFNWLFNLIDQWIQYLDDGSSGGGWPTAFVSNESELATAIAGALTDGGGVICVTQSMALVTSRTIPPNTVLVGRGGVTVITLGTGATLSLDTQAVMQNIYLDASKTSGNLVTMIGGSARIYNCEFSVLSTDALVCVSVQGNACGIESSIFRGVVAATAVGIQFEIGFVDNYESDNTFYA